MISKILIVEDEESILKLLSTIFGELDDSVILYARNGEEALKVARSEIPDIILLDVRLPGISGFDVCRSVKLDPVTSHSKVLMMSCLGQNFNWQKALEMGADGYIAKPFSANAIVEKVKELIGRK